MYEAISSLGSSGGKFAWSKKERKDLEKIQGRTSMVCPKNSIKEYRSALRRSRISKISEKVNECKGNIKKLYSLVNNIKGNVKNSWDDLVYIKGLNPLLLFHIYT